MADDRSTPVAATPSAEWRDRPIEISEGVAAAIGRITVRFALLEETVAGAIWSLIAGRDLAAPGALDDPEARRALLVGQTVTIPLSFANKVRILDRLVALRSIEVGGKGKELADLGRSLFAAEDMRNKVVHSVWLADSEDLPEGAVRLKARRGGGGPPTVGIAHVNAEALAEVGDTLLHATRMLAQLPPTLFNPPAP
jgi:hypothetical protein